MAVVTDVGMPAVRPVHRSHAPDVGSSRPCCLRPVLAEYVPGSAVPGTAFLVIQPPTPITQSDREHHP